jgi:acetyltransferase-like isoleucine patch superfamily enzyme
MQGKFKCLGDIRDLSFGGGCSITREPWPFFDVKGGGIVFGKNVVISSGVHVFTHDHQFNKKNWRELPEIQPENPTMICDDVFLGVNVLIMSSCKYIGKGSVIGAGSVVTKDVSDYEIWAGNPAVKIGEVK